MSDARPNMTENALADEMGHPASRRYFLRADQMSDGAFRYALEERETGKVLAEAIDPEEHTALAAFEKALSTSGLTPDEIYALRSAADKYDGK